MSKSIEQLIASVDFSSDNAYDEFYEIFTKIYPMPVLSVPIKAKSVMYRSRQNHNGNNFINYNDLSYPPKDVITEYSRANKPYEQIFYASDSEGTNLVELLPYWSSRVNMGETIAITTGLWQLDRDIIVGIIPDLENKNLMDFINNSQFSKQFKNNIGDWATINEFFRGQGFYDKNIYKVTSSYCNAVIQNIKSLGDDVQGVIYTSAQYNEGWNLALNPNLADNHLHLVRVGKQFIRRNQDENGKPTYDNFQEPQMAKGLDNKRCRILW